MAFRDVYAVPTYEDEHGVSASYKGVFVGRAASLVGAKSAARKHGFVVVAKGGEHGLAPASAFAHGIAYDAPMVYAVTVHAHRRSKKVANPDRKPIDHKFAGALFSAGHSKTALAYLRGTLTKSTARELAAGKKRR